MSTAFLIFLAPLYVIAALSWLVIGLVIFSAYESYHYRRKQKARR